MGGTSSNASAGVRHKPFRDVSAFLDPVAITVIGATEDNLGGVAVRVLRSVGYPGAIWPVHPRGQDVQGLPCYVSVGELPGVPDLALCAVSARRTNSVLEECADFGIGAAIVWAGGFAEAGEAGAALQKELQETCERTGLAILGPNCLGIINSALPSAPTFASFLVHPGAKLLTGDISMVSHSGGLAVMSQSLAQREGFGLRYSISTGNEAVLSAADFIAALAHDPGTNVIIGYLEGTRDGSRLLESFRRARDTGKPVVLLRGGKTEQSGKAAAAHTGALAGGTRVWDAALRAVSVIQVSSIEELLDTALFISSSKGRAVPSGPNVVAVSFGGGGGVVAADQCIRAGLDMPEVSSAGKDALRGLVPAIAAIGNPIDLTPEAFRTEEQRALFPKVVETIGASDEADIVLMLEGPMGAGGKEVAEAVCDYHARSPKTVAVSWPLPPPGVTEVLERHGVFAFQDYGRAARTLGQLNYYRVTRDLYGSAPAPVVPDFDWSDYISGAAAEMVVSEDRVRAILEGAGLPVAAGSLAQTEEAAVELANAIGLPVALKIISAEVTHRAAAGLVRLNVAHEADVRQAYRDLNAVADSVTAGVLGTYVQRMEPGGIEVIVAALRDPTFGTFVTCGAGGGLTELIDDVTLEPAPVSSTVAEAMLSRLRVVEKLGSDNELVPLVDFVARFSTLAASAPWDGFVLEINPVLWRRGDVIAVDGLLTIDALRANEPSYR